MALGAHTQRARHRSQARDGLDSLIGPHAERGPRARQALRRSSPERNRDRGPEPPIAPIDEGVNSVLRAMSIMYVRCVSDLGHAPTYMIDAGRASSHTPAFRWVVSQCEAQLAVDLGLAGRVGALFCHLEPQEYLAKRWKPTSS